MFKVVIDDSLNAASIEALTGQSGLIWYQASDTGDLYTIESGLPKKSADNDELVALQAQVANLQTFVDNKFVESDATTSTNTTTTFQTKATLNATPTSDGIYKVTFISGYNQDSNTSDIEMQFRQDAVNLGEIFKEEQKDNAGNFNATGSAQRKYVNKSYFVSLTASTAYSFDLQWRTDSAGVEASVWDTVIVLEKFS